jgi:dienelactone hydrolase
MKLRAAVVAVTLGAAAGLAGCGGGGGGSSSPPPSGTLTVADCTIGDGEATCLATVSWSTSGASTPRVIVGAATLSTATSGTTSHAVGTERLTVALYDGAQKLAERSIGGTCAPASASSAGGVCRAFAQRVTLRAPTPFFEAGVPVTLEVVAYRPVGSGPFPAVIVHHGSTGNGDDPSQFRLTWTSESVARFFAERGWMVLFPQRRGRGASGGVYDEGFEPDRSRYSCAAGRAQSGLERALDDAQASLAFVKSLNDVDGSRLLVAGTSRGGLLALVHAARNPGTFRGVVNFVGGWLGEGCGDALAVNRNAFVAAAASRTPSAWLYAEHDPFYSVAYSRAHFDAFAAASGTGSFHVHERAPGLSGHLLVNDPALWSADVAAFVAAHGG